MKTVFKKKLIIRSRLVCKFGKNVTAIKIAAASDPTTSTHTIVTTTTGM